MHSIAFVFGLRYLRYSIFYYTHIYNYILITFVIYTYICIFICICILIWSRSSCFLLQLHSIVFFPIAAAAAWMRLFFFVCFFGLAIFFCLAIVFWSFEIKMKTFWWRTIILYYTITINIQIKSFKSLKRRNLRFCFRIFSRNAENAQTIISMNSYKFLWISINLYLYLYL